jgi:hypothetical protein
MSIRSKVDQFDAFRLSYMRAMGVERRHSHPGKHRKFLDPEGDQGKIPLLEPTLHIQQDWTNVYRIVLPAAIFCF